MFKIYTGPGYPWTGIRGKIRQSCEVEPKTFNRKQAEIMPLLSGLTTMVSDFTNGLSLLIVGLIGLMWLSAGIIAFIAIQHYWAEKRRLPLREHLLMNDREAA